MTNTIRYIAFFPMRATPFRLGLALLRLMGLLPHKETRLVSPPHRILVVYLTPYLGDTVTMIPLLDRLHDIYPSAALEVVTSVAMTTFLEPLTYLSRVHGFSMKRGPIPVVRVYAKLFNLVRFAKSQLAGNSYDLCLLPRWGSDPELSPYLASMTSAPLICGHNPCDDASLGDMYPGMMGLLDCVSWGGQGLPEAVRQLRLLESCKISGSLDLAAEEKRPILGLQAIARSVSFEGLQARFGLPIGRYMIVAAGASHPSKRWPPNRFYEAAHQIGQTMCMHVLLVGGPSERGIGNEIQTLSQNRFFNLVGHTSLVEIACLMSRATFLIANDSGPGHLGAGLGVSAIVLSPTSSQVTSEVLSSPKRFRPIGPSVKVLQPREPGYGCIDHCSKSFAHCIESILVSEVVEAAKEMLKPISSID